MDLIRSCYTTRMRVWQDSNRTVKVRWFACHPDAKPLGIPTRFVSRNWLPDKSASWPTGEVKGARRPYAKCGCCLTDEPPGVPFGSPDVLRFGGRAGDPTKAIPLHACAGDAAVAVAVRLVGAVIPPPPEARELDGAYRTDVRFVGGSVTDSLDGVQLAGVRFEATASFARDPDVPRFRLSFDGVENKYVSASARRRHGLRIGTASVKPETREAGTRLRLRISGTVASPAPPAGGERVGLSVIGTRVSTTAQGIAGVGISLIGAVDPMPFAGRIGVRFVGVTPQPLPAGAMGVGVWMLGERIWFVTDSASIAATGLTFDGGRVEEPPTPGLARLGVRIEGLVLASNVPIREGVRITGVPVDLLTSARVGVRLAGELLPPPRLLRAGLRVARDPDVPPTGPPYGGYLREGLKFRATVTYTPAPPGSGTGGND